MLRFLIDNIYVLVGGQVFQQSTGIPISINCNPLLADPFYIHWRCNLSKSFYMRRRYHLLSIYYILCVDSIYANKLATKDITNFSTSPSYLDILLKFNANDKLTIHLQDKRDDFNAFPTYVVIFHHSLVNGFSNSRLIRYARACSTYDQFLIRGILLTDKLMSRTEEFLQYRLHASFRKFYGRYNTSFHLAKCCLMCFMPLVNAFLTH
jgi:hypothetical protein